MRHITDIRNWTTITVRPRTHTQWKQNLSACLMEYYPSPCRIPAVTPSCTACDSLHIKWHYPSFPHKMKFARRTAIRKCKTPKEANNKYKIDATNAKPACIAMHTYIFLRELLYTYTRKHNKVHILSFLNALKTCTFCRSNLRKRSACKRRYFWSIHKEFEDSPH